MTRGGSMSNYYKPWLSGAEHAQPSTPDHPLDKIRCPNGHYRYVVACMRNCLRPRYCQEFWDFFAARGEPPASFYNEEGVGELAMRRIVFDCDRCGRHDIGDVYSRYTKEGEGEEFLNDEAARREFIEECGFAWEDVGQFVFDNLLLLERERGWVHLCRKCFKQSVEWLAKICQVKPNQALKSRQQARKREVVQAVEAEDTEPENPARGRKGGDGGRKSAGGRRTGGRASAQATGAAATL